jgi:quinol monooxygenase YgiN
VLVVNRFVVPLADGAEFRLAANEAHRLLAAESGYLDGSVARNLDDPERWVLVTRWEGVGAYRRALSSYDVKAGAWHLLGRAIEEPSAYESADGTTELNDQVARSLR